MNTILIGLGFAIGIILPIEFSKLDKRKIGGLTLTAIAFIYVGFAASDMSLMGLEAAQALVFILISYYAIKKYVMLIPIGLLMHAVWDGMHLILGLHHITPPDYEILCVIVDVVLAAYFFFRLNSENINKDEK